MHDADARQTIL